MHVLIIASWYPNPSSPHGGIFIQQQVEELRKTEHKIGVISPFEQVRAVDRMNSGQDGSDVLQTQFINWLPFLPGSTAYFWTKTGMKLFQEYLAHHGQPDIIHAHSALYAGVLASKISQETHTPVLLTEHSSYISNRTMPVWKRRMVQRTFRTIPCKIAVSEFMRIRMIEGYEEDPESWMVLPNMVSTPFFEKPLYNPSMKSFVLTNIGSLIDVKAQHVLLRALHEVRVRGNQDVLLQIVGRGSREVELKKLSNKLGLGKNIKWVGRANSKDIPEIISNSHAVVSSSTTETFGMTLAEALALGKPVISTDSGGPRDIITPETGSLVPLNNPSALAGAIIDMYTRYDHYDPEKLRNYAKSKFSADHIIRCLLKQYERILQPEGHPEG